MLFAIDIDGTLCYANNPVYISACLKRFDLCIEPERLANLRQEAFFALPEVVAKREEIGAQAFDYQAGWLHFDPEVMLQRLLIPGALAGVKKLAEMGQIAYYTARFSRNAEQHQGMVDATEAWLTEHDFPEAEVVYCDRIAGKLTMLAQRSQERGEQVVLIDDSYEQILQQVGKLDCPVERLTLVALRAKEMPEETHGMRVVLLRNWRYIDQLEKEFTNAV